MAEPGAARSTTDLTADVEVQDVRRDRRVGAAKVVLSLAGMVVGPAAFGAVGLGSLGWIPGLAAVVFYLASALSLAATDRGPGERRLSRGRVTIEGDHLSLTQGSTPVSLPLSRLTGGWTERTARGHAAILSFADGRVAAIERGTEEEASALLVEAGAGAHARAVRMRGYREDSGGRKIAGFFLALFAPLILPLVASLPILIFIALAEGSIKPLLLFPTFLAGAAPFLMLTAWMWSKVKPTWIQIGTDGVVFPGFFRRQFVPHGAIVRATCETDGVLNVYKHIRIELRDGTTRKIPAASHEEALAMIDRIQAAQRVASGQERARLLESISRNGRTLSEWRSALGSLLARAGYRTAAHDLEEVLRIVEDPVAPREQRVGAALAARSHGGEAQGRIRIAAEACADPRLRVALEGAATGEIGDPELEALAAAGEARVQAVRG